MRISRRPVMAIACALAAVLLAGCHDETRGGVKRPTAGRLPIVPGETRLPPGPAVLETIKPYRTPKGIDRSGWQLAIVHLDKQWRLNYRVPYDWVVDGRGRARNPDSLVSTRAEFTTLTSDEFALAAYAAQLAEDQPIHTYTTADGHTVYVTARVVSVAPTDPNAERYVFHTAVLEIDGRIAKFEMSYAPEQQWRFREICDAVLGTIDIRQVAGTD